MGDVRARVRQREAPSLARAFSILLLSLGAGLAVASCGRDGRLSQQQYERELDEAGREIESAFDGVREELRRVGSGSASLDDAAARLDEARGSLDRTADELDGIEPPADAAEAHDRLVEGLGDLSDEFAEFRAAVESGNVPTIHRYAQDFQALDAVEQIERALAELERRGNDVPSRR